MANTASKTIIQAIDVNKEVSAPEGQLHILSSINLGIQEGESVAITGPSGAGKSTLIGLLAGLDTPSSGQIFFQGKELTRLDEDGRALLRAGRVGFVFQSFQLLPHLTALENVMLPLELAENPEPVQTATKVLTRVGLSGRLRHYPNQLSGGEQQRVAIARAFAVEPKLLFADEPTGNLDQVTGRAVTDLLFDLNREQGTTLILVTHEIGLASRCDRHIALDSGSINSPR